jgi:hypothetical protein
MWLDYWHRQEVFLSSNFQIGYGAHPISYSMSISGEFPWGVSGQNVKQASHLHLVLRLKLFYSSSLNTGWQSWVRSSSYVYLNNMLMIWTNTMLSGRCQIHKNKCQGREASLYGGMNYNNIMRKNLIIRLKLIHNHVTELLRYNLNGTAN